MSRIIPNKIHYCWFGGNPIPEKYKEYIESWRKYCPDYEIIEWNEDNFSFDECEYAKEAYKAKKWAFVSDYARFKILHDHGGLYFDTDVELVRSINDIIDNGPFMGIESVSETDEPGRITVAPGLGLAAYPNMDIYKDMLNKYHDLHFIKEDGSYNLKTVVEYTTELLQGYGLVNENKIQDVAGIRIYPKDYFNPFDSKTGEIIVTDNTVSIHHFAASWVDPYSKMRGRIYRWAYRSLGSATAELLRSLFGRNR